MITAPKSEVRPNARKVRRRIVTLQPQAYDENAMPSLKLARSSRFARRVGRVILALLLIGFVVVGFAPWQQFARGSGSVIGYSPQSRPQTIEAPIKGRIVELGDNIFENASVEEGQVIAEIQDLDPSYLERLENQLEAKVSKVDSLKNLVVASEGNLTAAKMGVTALQSLVKTYESAKLGIVASAEASIESARNKVTSLQQKLKENEAALTQYEADFQRQQQLFKEDIVSQKKFQEAKQKYEETLAKVEQAKADILSAQAELRAKERERDAKAQKAQSDIEYAISQLNKAEGEVEKAKSEISKAESDLQSAQSDLLEAESKVARQQRQVIEAPFDGIVTRITPNLGSQMLKEGDPICLIVPDTEQRAVQIWLDGNDATLVSPGRHVRLQFEGWPAVQFAGWPSVAVGTFGGEIVSVDATDNGKGQFRAIVLPDEDSPDWPQGRYLRQGVRANAWVLLNKVPLWYELWRQMNGFPPVVDTEEPKSKPMKAPKLPKA